MRRFGSRVRASVALVLASFALLASGAARAIVVVEVTDVEELYEAVNDPALAPARIVLAPNLYMLDEKDSNGDDRPNGGRLDLKAGVDLRGVPGNPVGSVIDASELAAVIATSAIRVGLGANKIEWLTVRDAVNMTAAISADQVAAGVSPSVRISHCIITGGQRGIDLRNNQAAAAGRMIEARIEHTEIADNVTGVGTGLRVANLGSANGGVVRVELVRNDIHDNLLGCLAANQSSSDARIAIASHGDRFDENTVGCILIGGLGSAATAANDNVVTFRTQTGSFADNVGLVAPDNDNGAIIAIGGASTGTVTNRANRNTLEVDLRTTRFSGNQQPDIGAWGARTFTAPLAGVDNRVVVIRRGLSKNATAAATPSLPDEAVDTNTVVLVP